jgi:hypothetical protein
MCCCSLLSQSFDVFSFNKLAGLFFHCVDFLDLLICLRLDFSLQKPDLLDVQIVLKSHECLQVISLQSQGLLVFIVINDQEAVFLFLHLFLQENIIICGLHEGNSQVSWKNDRHDVYLFNHYTIRRKLLLKLILHSSGQLSLNISDSSNFDLLQEVSDFFIAFFLEELFKSIRTKVVEKLTGIFLLRCLRSSNVEVNPDVDRDSHVIFGWHVSYWAFEPDCVLGDHDCDALVVAVAASETWLHDTLINAPLLLKREYSVWHIHLTVTAAWIFHDDHDWNSIRVVLRDQARSFFWVVGVELNQVCFRSEASLHVVVVCINLLHH